MGYRTKGKLAADDTIKLDRYTPILEKDDFKADESHWRMLSKNTISLFQVLIDQDLKDLVLVLESYPKYTHWVCEHFRYAYSYSEHEADINSASKLLQFGEPYFSKQFVRNVVRKLPKLDDMDFEQISLFNDLLAKRHNEWHPIIVNHFYNTIMDKIDDLQLHPLQSIVLKKPLKNIELQETYEYDADDRDAVLDIPYMN